MQFLKCHVTAERNVLWCEKLLSDAYRRVKRRIIAKHFIAKYLMEPKYPDADQKPRVKKKNGR